MTRVALVLALVAWATPSRAQPAGAQAEVLFRQGRDLMAAGKVAEACSAFEASQKLDPATATLLNLAGCREKIGQVATAWGLFLDAERQTRSASDDATRQLHDLAQGRAQSLEARVSKLTVNVPQKSQIDGLEISHGKDRIDSVMWNRALPIDGGTYTITARAPNANTWSTEVTIANEGDTKTVEIPDLRNLAHDLGPPAPPAPVAITTPRNDDSAGSPPRSSNLVPIVVGAGAVALLGGALGFELSGDSTYNDAKAETMDQARRDSLYDSANTKRYAAEGLAVAGVAAAGVAVWLYVRGGHDEPAGNASALHIVPTGSGISIVGSY